MLKADTVMTVKDDSAPQNKIVFKLINDQWWVEFDISDPLDRANIRLWKSLFPVFQRYFSGKGYNQFLAGCSTPERVKYASMFNFKKIREITMDGKAWSVVAMCF